MRVLFVTTEFPWPVASGGQRRTLAQLRALAAIPELTHVSLLSITPTPVPSADLVALREAIREGGLATVSVEPPALHPVHLWESPRHLPRMLAARVFRGLPYFVAKWECPALAATLRRMLAQETFDLVYFERLGATAAHGALPLGQRAVVDQQNVEHEIMQRFATSQRGPMRWLAEHEARVTKRYEARMLDRAAHVITISAKDARLFRTLSATPVTEVPMAVAVTARAPVTGRLTLGYLGSLRWHPSVFGLDWFCRTVWPRVRAALPDATLEIGGAGLAPGEVPPAWRLAGVVVSGFQTDPSELYARCSAMIAPVVGGGGASIKVLDCLAAGLPVVTTPDGAAGLAVTHERELLIGEDSAAFADCVVRVLRQPELADRLARAGQAFIACHHSPGAAVTALRRALQLATHDHHQ